MIIEEFKAIKMCWMYGGYLTTYLCKEVTNPNSYCDVQGRLAAVFDFILTDLYFLNVTQYTENRNSGEAFRMCFIMLGYTISV